MGDGRVQRLPARTLGTGPVRATLAATVTDSPEWLALRAELKRLALTGGAWAKAGFLGDNDSRPPEDGGGKGMTNARLAAIHEYGVEDATRGVHIPARPFVAPAFDANLPKYEARMAQFLAGLLAGRVSVETGLGLMGLGLVADIRAFVTQGPPVPPPNAPSTLERKLAMSSGAPWGVRTLVDTGRMLGSLAHAVVYFKPGDS